jgi:hypothetical protein
MPKKTNKRRNKGKKTRKQKVINMIGCFKKGKKSCSNKKPLGCPNCGPNCHCGPNCKCPHPCPGNCYLNRRMKKQKGGQGCGSCGCPLSPMSWNQMNKFGGNGVASYPEVLKQQVINDPLQNGYQPILGIGQSGGTCGACNQVIPNLSGGGNFFKPIGPMPGPEVGGAWGPNLKWPTMNGIGSDRNYLANYSGVISNDPTRQISMNDAGYLTKNSMVGGYRYSPKTSSSSPKSKKGGGLVPQDLINLGRDFSYNFKTAYNALNGYKAPVNPAPYKDQLTGALTKGS